GIGKQHEHRRLNTWPDAMKHRSVKSRGFTLLELMLAMALMAIVSISLYASMHVAWRAKRSAEAAVQPVRSGAIAADLVCHDLESVPPPTGILAGPFLGTQQSGTFPGSELDVLDFYTIGEDATPAQQTQLLQEGMRHVELAVRTDVDPPVLVRRITKNLLALTQEDPEEEVLCRGVRSLTIRYFDGSNWAEDWDSTQENNVLPQAVELTLELQADPSLPASQQQATSLITRTIPLACAKPATDQSSSGTGGTQ